MKMKGTTIAQAIKCAAKVRAGGKCSVAEMAGALDTLAWAYKKGKMPASSLRRRVAHKSRKVFRRKR